MKLTDNNSNSLLLQFGNLQLKDTAETFQKHKIVSNFEYTPLNQNNSQTNEYSQLGLFIIGDHRQGVKIKCNNAEIFFVYGANRPSSNAHNIAIGYFARTKYHFIRESFSNIYEENPEVVIRAVITTNDLFKPTKIKETIIFHKYSKNPIKILTKQENQFIKSWIKNIRIFEEAFLEEQLIALDRRRFNALENDETKEKYLKFYQ